MKAKVMPPAKGKKVSVENLPAEVTEAQGDWDLQKQLDAIATLLTQGYSTQKTITTVIRMSEMGRFPLLNKKRAAELVKVVTSEWKKAREEERADDYVVRLAQLEELVYLCRNGVKDPNDPNKWVARPSRMTELQARQELHKMLGYYDDRPQLNINILNAQVAQSNLMVLADAGAVLSQVMHGQLPSPEEADLLEARRILAKGEAQ